MFQIAAVNFEADYPKFAKMQFDKVCSDRAAILCQNYYCSMPNVLNILDVVEKQNERLTSRNGWKNLSLYFYEEKKCSPRL